MKKLSKQMVKMRVLVISFIRSRKENGCSNIGYGYFSCRLGGSGVASALSAAEAMYEKNGKDASKVSVLGIDKAGKYGGTSAVTTSPMTINPSYFVEKNNGENYVDADVLKNAWMEYTRRRFKRMGY